MTQALLPSLWFHQQSSPSSSPLPARGSRSWGQEGITGLVGSLLLFTVFPRPTGSSADFWSAIGGLPWSGPSTPWPHPPLVFPLLPSLAAFVQTLPRKPTPLLCMGNPSPAPLGQRQYSQYLATRMV